MSNVNTSKTDTTIRSKRPGKWVEIILNNIEGKHLQGWLASVIYWRWCDKEKSECTELEEMMELYYPDDEIPISRLKEGLSKIGIKTEINKYFTTKEEWAKKKGKIV
jgi:hypothetical protein